MLAAQHDHHVTRAVGAGFRGIGFAGISAVGVSRSKLKSVLRAREARDRERLLAQRELLDRRVARGSALFAGAGFDFPLSGQLSETIEHGFASAPPVIAALIRCEMLTGVLMGVQDAASLSGSLSLDRIGSGGESFEGMRGAVRCREGEIVVRDDRGIVASLFRGPGQRAAVDNQSTDVTFIIFDLPGLETALDDATQCLTELLAPCSTALRCVRARRAG
jgi:hypothetical protein